MTKSAICQEEVQRFAEKFAALLLTMTGIFTNDMQKESLPAPFDRRILGLTAYCETDIELPGFEGSSEQHL